MYMLNNTRWLRCSLLIITLCPIKLAAKDEGACSWNAWLEKGTTPATITVLGICDFAGRAYNTELKPSSNGTDPTIYVLQKTVSNATPIKILGKTKVPVWFSTQSAQDYKAIEILPEHIRVPIHEGYRSKAKNPFEFDVPIGDAQFIGHANLDDVSNPSAQGYVLVSGIPVGTFDVNKSHVEFVAFDVSHTHKVAVHIHFNTDGHGDLQVLFALINPFNGDELNNFGGWHTIAQWR
jgi:hypothetical protein